MSTLPRPQEYDAIVVGSGASGGWAAKRMSEAGMRVALVCAGRPLTDGDYREHVQPYELKYQARANDLIRRSRPVQKDCYACTEYLSLIHISEPTRLLSISYAVFCLKKK